ncbi:MAG: hypothetical protein KGR26_14355 [Cyanobacteria bacterium REEB65]|nr:hypothetical protein [Cyanobacteria bacterium REEB65]
MDFSWQDLVCLRRAGMRISTLTVLAYINETAKTKPTEIGEACRLTERTVYSALRQIRELESQLGKVLLHNGRKVSRRYPGT